MASFRLINKKNFMKRSCCVKCKQQLSALELLPVLSYILQKGKCKKCKSKVSIRYPLIEIATGLAFFVISLQHQNNISLLVTTCLITVGLMIMIITDFEYYIIPDEVQIYLGLLSLIYNYQIETPISNSLIFAFVSYSIALAMQKIFKYWAKKEGLGDGDVKFFAVAGLYLDIHSLSIFLFISGLLGVIIARLWLRMGYGKVFPFGPALAISLFICLLYPELTSLFY